MGRHFAAELAKFDSNDVAGQVYNETIYDLLDQHGVGPLGQRQPLRVSEDANGQVMVAGLIEVHLLQSIPHALHCNSSQLLSATRQLAPQLPRSRLTGSGWQGLPSNWSHWAGLQTSHQCGIRQDFGYCNPVMGSSHT